MDPDLDPTSVNTLFRKYLDRYKVYVVVINIKENERKRALFLHCAGNRRGYDGVCSINLTLCKNLWISGEPRSCQISKRRELKWSKNVAETNSTEKVYQVGPVRPNNPSIKECFSYSGTFPHASRRRKYSGWGRNASREGEWIKHCSSKGTVQEGTVKRVSKEVPSDSSDAKSLCSIEVIRAVKESNPRHRPIRNVKIENWKVNVLVDQEPL